MAKIKQEFDNNNITEDEYNQMISGITPVQRFETNQQGAGTKFCDGESCTI